MPICHLCMEDAVENILDLGVQPICNRFQESVSNAEPVYPMVLGQCHACGLVQMTNPVPASELKPLYDWVSYREPEKHLDQLVDILCSLSGVTLASSICGVSHADTPLLNRLKDRGFSNTWNIDPHRDLGINDPNAGIETIQGKITEENVNSIIQNHGKPYVVLASFILEHCHYLKKFIAGLKRLAGPHGYLIITVPGFEKVLVTYDFSALWEEHIFYFTKITFQHCLRSCGFSLNRFMSFPYALEDCLTAICQTGNEVPAFMSSIGLENEISQVQIFTDEFFKTRDSLGKFFTDYRKTYGDIALLGAGHRSCIFINMFGLQKHIKFVVDDDSHKQDMLMPGSLLPVYGSAALYNEGVRLCLLGINPESEENVLQVFQDFIQKGGEFYSIFPQSNRALRIRHILYTAT